MIIYEYIPIDQRNNIRPFKIYFKEINILYLLAPDSNLYHALNVCLASIIDWDNMHDKEGKSITIKLSETGTIEIQSLLLMGDQYIKEVANTIYDYLSNRTDEVKNQYKLKMQTRDVKEIETMTRFLTAVELTLMLEKCKIEESEKKGFGYLSKDDALHLKQMSQEERQALYKARESQRIDKNDIESKKKLYIRNFAKFAEIDEKLKSHIDVLARKKQQLIIKDDYGLENRIKWETELNYFKKNVLEIGTFGTELLHKYISERLEYMLFEYEIKKEKQVISFHNSMSPYEYEHYCAQLLNKSNWQTRVTQASGDQGVDIIATKNGKKIAVQCKLYGLPVGNKAVQEVFAAKQHIDADYAMVVTNSSFTKSAKELANTTGVMLLHHSELEDLD